MDSSNELLLYDRVIANPPFSLKNWGREEAEDDAYGRFRFGVPPKNAGDYGFIQHMVATLTYWVLNMKSMVCGIDRGITQLLV